MSYVHHLFIRAVAGAGLVMLFGGCDLSPQLKGQPCLVEKDCWKSQECARTADEEALELPGMCQPEGTGCVVGGQLGCACVLDILGNDCSIAAVVPALLETYPRMVCDPKALVCVQAPPMNEEQP